jgi:hypothetical protein
MSLVWCSSLLVNPLANRLGESSIKEQIHKIRADDPHNEDDVKIDESVLYLLSPRFLSTDFQGPLEGNDIDTEFENLFSFADDFNVHDNVRFNAAVGNSI